MEFDGTTSLFELLLGGTPAPGLVLGAGLIGSSIMQPTSTLDGVEEELDNVSVNISQLMLFAQFYTDPHAGFYLQALFGYATSSITIDNITYETDPSGPVGGLGLGYDFWVSNQWSLGPLFRFTYARLKSDNGEQTAKDTFTSPSLALSVTYH